MSPESYILITKIRKTSHIFHLIMSIISFGLWVPLWLIVGINNGIENARMHRRIRIIEERESLKASQQ